jgi:DNA-binding CsgD family transcriptional regulator
LALVELAKTSLSGPTKRTNPLTPTVSLTPALEAAFSRRWTDLPETSQAAVLVAALDADASLQEILAASTRLCQIEVTIAVLEPAQALGLLSFHETRVRFSHPLVMAAIAQKQAISRTQAAHRALGEVVAVNSHRRAWHRALGSAALDDAIATELEATTRGSIHRGGTETAIMALERAAQLSTVPAERGRRLLLAAKHAFRLGRADLAVRLLSTVAGIELSDFDRVRAELLREELEGSVIDASNRVMQLCDVAQRAAGAGEMELALEVAYAAARRRCTAPVDAHACAATVSVARNLDRLSGDARVLAVFALADPIGQGRVVLSALDEIAALGEIADLNDHELDADALGAYAVAARAVGHYSFALALFDRAESELRSGRLFGALARNLCAAADLRLELGEWERAADALAEFQTLSSASMSANHRAAALATTAKAAALRGECTRALELVAETEHSPAARSGSSYLARAQIVRGIAHISSGHHGDAFAALHRVFEPDDPSSHFREQFGAVGYLAEAAVQSGNRDQARAVVDRMQLIADVSGSPVLITQLAYAKAILAPDDAAEGLFIAALASDSACAPWPRARLQLAYGRWLRRQQRVTQSRGPLQAALTTLQRIGARRWAEEASDELEASGVNGPDRAEGQGFNILSAQESKIARLVAQGLSNREIGQQLYLLPRTVSSHLYRMFPKLGISTRTQLASRLDEHELAAPNGT